jgi:hypothetical protein
MLRHREASGQSALSRPKGQSSQTGVAVIIGNTMVIVPGALGGADESPYSTGLQDTQPPVGTDRTADRSPRRWLWRRVRAAVS